MLGVSSAVCACRMTGTSIAQCSALSLFSYTAGQGVSACSCVKSCKVRMILNASALAYLQRRFGPFLCTLLADGCPCLAPRLRPFVKQQQPGVRQDVAQGECIRLCSLLCGIRMKRCHGSAPGAQMLQDRSARL